MPADTDTDKFVIATLALWAGDFSYCEQLLREFAPPHGTPPIDDNLESPEALIRANGALRLRQLRRKRAEFKKFAAEFTDADQDITDNPTVLETKHLRATIWRTGEREFLMQGYLNNLAWQDALFESARRVAGGAGVPKRSTSPRQPDLFEPELASQPTMPPGVAWVIVGNPFIQVQLTDLGLLEATGLWTGLRLPNSAEAIKAPFLRLLEALDKPPMGATS